MVYKWEEASEKKYGVEATRKLIKQQVEYEAVKKDNDCKHCGKGNEGSIIELKSGTPFVMHFGLWSNGRCNYCGQFTTDGD